jgi:hypothetical protein
LRFVSLELMNNMDPKLREFILFCIERGGKEWPIIYDEMANVAGQRLFKGMGHTELKQVGLSLSFSNIDKLKRQIEQVTDQTIQF